jgi:hypothetical protein
MIRVLKVCEYKFIFFRRSIVHSVLDAISHDMMEFHDVVDCRRATIDRENEMGMCNGGNDWNSVLFFSVATSLASDLKKRMNELCNGMECNFYDDPHAFLV